MVVVAFFTAWDSPSFSTHLCLQSWTELKLFLLPLHPPKMKVLHLLDAESYPYFFKYPRHGPRSNGSVQYAFLSPESPLFSGISNGSCSACSSSSSSIQCVQEICVRCRNLAIFAGFQNNSRIEIILTKFRRRTHVFEQVVGSMASFCMSPTFEQTWRHSSIAWKLFSFPPQPP